MTRRYPAYVDTGLIWLRDVPSSWKLVRLGSCFAERKEKVSDKDFPALSVTMNGIVPQLETAAKTDDGDNRKLVRKGDFVINSRSDRKGSSGLSDLDGSVSLISIVIEPNEEIHGRFANWLLKSRSFQEEFYRWGSGIVADLWSTRYADMKSITLALPSLPEQIAIAAFLDRETTKIDALVEEKQRLIDLLREKRQVVNSHAVTRGLNPAAKLKPSGVEWLGDVPEGWTVKQLKHLVADGTTITYGIVQAGPEHEGGIPYIRTSDMSGPELPTSGYPLTSPEIEQAYVRSRVFPGDIVIAIRATVGKCLPVPDELRMANLTQGTAKVSPGDDCDRDFLLFALSGSASQTYFELMAKGATFREITLDALRRLPLPLPSLDEQREIAKVLRSKTERLGKLIDEAETTILLLQERRAALISAAVTGKIDVRESITDEVAA
ncbi:MAG: restriction endonuclease subunit S [Rhodobacteraceae bacterium]|nr:restriction endonuclease subunit S [Paracoccaceae bacterium]